MSSSRASTVSGGQHKKVLRTRVKVLAKYQLRPSEAFDIDMADQLIHRAIADKASVTTMMKLYGDGLRFGEKGILSPLHVEFVTYPSVTAFISLRELPTVLAICMKIGQANGVTVVQFKDLEALQVVCEVIDRQRGLMTGAGGRANAGSMSSGPAASSISRVEVSATAAAAKEPPKPTTPTVIVTTAAEPPAPAVVAVTVTTSEIVTTTSSSSNGNGIFEKRQFTADITQPPPPPKSQEVEVANVVVHASAASTTAAAPRDNNHHDEDDDDDHFRTSIVFGTSDEPQSPRKQLDASERQRRMESVLLRAANGSGGNRPPSATAATIDAVILNYDDVDTEGTHAVFDSLDGPPVQLNESAVNLRRPESLLRVQRTSATAAAAASASDSRPRGSRLVVTSFSSGCSDDSPETASSRVHLRSTGEPSYRTSTVIYRDAPSNSSQLLDSPTDRPRVTYVSNQRASPVAQPSPQYQQYQQYQQPQHQSMQLVRLVPVGQSARVQQRRVVQQQQPTQYFTIQPVGARENGVHLVAK